MDKKLVFDENVFQLVLPPIGTNCFIIQTSNENCIAVDPASETERILRFLKNKQLLLKKILLTHGHFDHIGACAGLKEKTGAEIYISREDSEMLRDPEKALHWMVPNSTFAPFDADVLVKEGDVISQDGFNFTVMETPGHTRGSVCYITDGAIFAGDTIFEGSVGRTDCYSGDPAAQRRSLKRLAALSGSYTIYCGHGPVTTLADELASNPYLMNS